MATTLDPKIDSHSANANTGIFTPVTYTDLSSRASFVTESDKDMAGKVGKTENGFTAGFLIENIDELLPKTGNDTETDNDIDIDIKSTEVIGWVFLFPPFSVERPNEVLISAITINQISLITRSNDDIFIDVSPLTRNNEPVQIKPGIYGSAPYSGGGAHDMSYEDAHNLFNPFFLPDSNLHFSRLEGYESWAELSFLGRSDLDLMRTYLDTSFNGYNDFFFSGARMDYRTMHNPKLKVQQHTLVGKVTGIAVPDSSKAFTLKVEPIVMDKGESKSNNNSTQRLSGNTDSIPIVAKMEPCPDYWDYIGGIARAAAYQEDGLRGDAQNKMADGLAKSQFTGMETIQFSVPGISLQPEREDFFDRLRNLWNAFKALFQSNQ